MSSTPASRSSPITSLLTIELLIATAEISRTQLWQWIHHGTKMDDGRVVTAEFVHATVDLVLDNVCDRLGEQAFNDGRFAEAATVFRSLTDNEQLEDWLTLLAYEHL